MAYKIENLVPFRPDDAGARLVAFKAQLIELGVPVEAVEFEGDYGVVIAFGTLKAGLDALRMPVAKRCVDDFVHGMRLTGHTLAVVSIPAPV